MSSGRCRAGPRCVRKRADLGPEKSPAQGTRSFFATCALKFRDIAKQAGFTWTKNLELPSCRGAFHTTFERPPAHQEGGAGMVGRARGWAGGARRAGASFPRH